ncbi:acyltransferase family protein [Shimia sediminis]|uniref:acyltransferase family protein n=1 Tax=Shimia sediminis TaxID=2497945 RepID=UPI000F8F7322|nr:acyltransferase [Shimia sediminis]
MSEAGNQHLIGGEGEPSRLGDVSTMKVALALLLVFTHGLTWLHGVDGSKTHLAPAVPVFLFISGYFMFANYKRAPYPLRFMATRYLKLLPIMVASLVASCGLILLYSGWPIPSFAAAELPWLALGMLTVFQSYVPPGFDALDGSIRNGSLWFIEAILVLYATLPIIAWGERRWKGLLLVLFVISACFSTLFPAYVQSVGGLQSFAADLSIPPKEELNPVIKHVMLIGLRVMTSAWMFYAGCLVRRYQKELFSRGLGVAFLCVGMAVTLLLYAGGHGDWNHFGSTPLWYFPAYLVGWLFLNRVWLQKLRVPPISIGLYVWHIPVFHALNYLGYGQLWIAVPAVMGIAWLSLLLIERPMAQLISRSKIMRQRRPSLPLG